MKKQCVFLFLRTLLKDCEVREVLDSIYAGKQWLYSTGKRWVSLGLVVLGIVAIFPRNRRLTDIARPVVKVDTMSEKVAWTAGNRFLLLSTQKERQSGPEEPGQTFGSKWQGTVDLIDAGSHTRKRLNALTGLLNLTGLDFASFRTSPDGKWVLWQNAYSSAHPLPYVYVAKPDGTACRRWIRGVYGQDLECYLDDNHILQVANQMPAIIVHDLEHPARDQKYRTVTEAQDVLDRYVRLHPTVIRIIYDPGDMLTACVVSDSYDPNRNRPLPLPTASPLASVFGSTHPRRLSLPHGANVRYAWISPQQQAIVYVLDFTRTHPVLGWLHRYVRKIPAVQTTTEELWISRIDGKEMRSLGMIPVQPDLDSLQEYRLQDVQWLPDGKHVSFLYRGTLYQMAAEVK